MCRLFGFRSNERARVHHALVAETNSLQRQSREHKDGWGIAYYGDANAPEVAHGLGPAHADPEFERVSGLVSSHAVLAHVRLASVGDVAVRNAHPFLQGPWAFAHNGNIRDFAQHKAEIEQQIDPALRASIRGETDSERCFYLFLTHLQRLDSARASRADAVARALASTTVALSSLTDRPDDQKPSSMNFMVTDGALLVASRRNRTLYFSDGSPRQEKAAPTADRTPVTQLVIASEELLSQQQWHEIADGEIVGVDAEMAFRRWTVSNVLE